MSLEQLLLRSIAQVQARKLAASEPTSKEAILILPFQGPTQHSEARLQAQAALSRKGRYGRYLKRWASKRLEQHGA